MSGKMRMKQEKNMNLERSKSGKRSKSSTTTEKIQKKQQKLKNKAFLEYYIKKLFKQTAPECSLSSGTLQVCEDFTVDLLSKFQDEMQSLAHFVKPKNRSVDKKNKEGEIIEGEKVKIKQGKTLGLQEVFSAAKLILPQDIQGVILSEAEKVVKLYQTEVAPQKKKTEE